ncbi:MAG: hypothetical protein JWM82_492 [Myxococcales bacterium]|nr:hypothetical protein [Myxococcales bacterium]
MGRPVLICLVGVTSLVSQLGAARAAPLDADGVVSVAPRDAARSAGRGVFLPLSQAASVDTQRAAATAFAGYDSARKAGVFEAATEVHLWGPFALRGGAVYANENRTVRPSVGLRAQTLRQERHGVDGALGLFYRPEGLTEPEGELEGMVSLGRRAGNSYLLGSLVYGQDPEGRERDGEVRLAALHPMGAWALAGFDSRVRLDLGSNRAVLTAHHEPTLDGLIGPLVTALAGPFALSIHGGASLLRPSDGPRTLYGVFFMGGVGTTF